MVNLLSTWSAEYEPLAKLTYYDNKLLYAKKHGYGCYHVIHEPGNVLWGRVEEWNILLNSLPEGDWIWFSGTDLFITQPSYKLEDYIDNDYEFICCVDGHQVFGDCFLIKVCSNTKRLLKEVLNRRHEFGNEQVALSTILSSSQAYEFYCQKVGNNFGTTEFYAASESILNTNYVKVKVMNPLLPKKICGDLNWVHDAGLWVVPPQHTWYEDTFSLHLGGKSLHFRLGIMPYLTRDLKF